MREITARPAVIHAQGLIKVVRRIRGNVVVGHRVHLLVETDDILTRLLQGEEYLMELIEQRNIVDDKMRKTTRRYFYTLARSSGDGYPYYLKSACSFFSVLNHAQIAEAGTDLRYQFLQ